MRLTLAAGLACAASGRAAADPDALWRIVHGQCQPDELRHHDPRPCAAVDLRRGYAVLKDRRGASQFLLLPTRRISGIEDPRLLAPQTPRYWQAAWDARRRVGARLQRRLPAGWLSLAVNSAGARSQDQLHIHIDCVAAGLPAWLAAHVPDRGGAWSPVALQGHAYRVRRVATLDSRRTDPFRLVARTLPGAAAAMARESILVLGIGDGEHATGFYVLETHADALAGNPGAAEELQDHDCALAHLR
ncbi:MAG: CDP-diacylglycerol diphosphatase [Burkholderiales bacterium]|nr:CDP-diacylglycerol diphosphatase [Burkholderiales bacterium]MDE1927809.1 CDP-diacylglycerol diphosphatase [Burkholderiales bacterium]MDE2159914.1 CDP-diacylglycerol diphosphatase [Burkholderiales bacterium]MDE2504213.1 CDP-diacylglycerol diphosphatase [Burkholderiales bacterium]